MALSPIQRLVIQRLASGQTPEEVADAVKLPYRVIKRWMREPDVALALDSAVGEHNDLIEAMLLAGEREASNTLIEALSANTAHGKPDWATRMKAAMSLMDRAGQRGRAVEKQQVTGSMVVGNVEDALAKALRDPGVRAWIATDERYAPMLKGTAETVDAEVIPNE